jgi:hypothetical protein
MVARAAWVRGDLANRGGGMSFEGIVSAVASATKVARDHEVAGSNSIQSPERERWAS